MVARYVTDEKLRASWYLWKDVFKLMSGRFKSAELFARLVNAGGDLVCTRYTMPLGEALDAGSGGAPIFLLFSTRLWLHHENLEIYSHESFRLLKLEIDLLTAPCSCSF